MAFIANGSFASFNKGQMDAFMVNLARAGDGFMTNADAFRNFLAAHTDAEFEAASTNPGPTGYAAGSFATIRSGFQTDFGALVDGYRGTSVWTPARDMRTFVKLVVLLGMG
jgi:hypothetical protein